MRALFAVAEEKIAAAGSAKIAREEVSRAEPSGKELRAIGQAKIEMDASRQGPVARRGHIQPLERIRLIAGARLVEIFSAVGKLRRKFCDQLRPYLVAARPNGGSQCGEQVGWLAAELKLHAADSLFGDPREGAAPARMDRGDGTFFRVDKQNRHAVRRLNPEKQAGPIRC